MGALSLQFGGVTVERGVPCTMRDGITLYADVYRPEGEDKLPVLLMRQLYGRAIASTVTSAHPLWYARQGYMVVVQDVRGRGESEGEAVPFAQEVEDGYDTVEWAAQLPRANGRVGMYGFSYQGSVQWAAAASGAPSLIAIAPGMCAADLYHGRFYPHGRFAWGAQLMWAFQFSRDGAKRAGDEEAAAYCERMMRDAGDQLWKLPLTARHPILEQYCPFFYEWLSHTEYDAYWEQHNWVPRLVERPIPTLQIGGWYDTFLQGTLQTYNALSGTETEDVFHRLLIGPWAHIPWGRMAGGVDHGPEADGDVHREQLRWFNYWLKGERSEQLETEPPIRYYEQGSGQWRTMQEWPAAEHMGVLAISHGAENVAVARRTAAANEHRVLHSSSQDVVASSGASSAVVEGDGHTSDAGSLVQYPLRWYLSGSAKPANGALGGGKLTSSPEAIEAAAPDVYVYDARLPMQLGGYLPFERSSQQDRYEILVYTSDPFDVPASLSGLPRLTVHCQTMDGPTDLVAVLSVVQQGGKARFLSVGRMEVGRGEENGGGEWLPATIELRPLAIELQPGERLRLELTGSAFPLFARHLNGLPSEEIPDAGPERLSIATVAVASEPQMPSMLVIVPPTS
ncbi:CocE/NonD family hydrolase [Paenibacillus daejeonensis]|uniref:CocE/NonD family hydrolase n=1 Tax=Paenibacillus daejeonensis TaxID=135193 RepID=UPI00037E905C|nr:CocE/NonD family hydrolase [Paenibacillus daejeonensis]